MRQCCLIPPLPVDRLCKTEVYHRYIKQSYNSEDIQIGTFTGFQSMLEVLTVSMYMIYKKIKAVHYDQLLDSGYNYLNKLVMSELTNFIYCFRRLSNNNSLKSAS